MKPIAARYGTLADNIEAKVTTMTIAASKLQGAAEAVGRKNADLMAEVRELSWWILPAMALALLIIGAFLGSGWEQRQSTQAVFELQNQVEQLRRDSAHYAPCPAGW